MCPSAQNGVQPAPLTAASGPAAAPGRGRPAAVGSFPGSGLVHRAEVEGLMSTRPEVGAAGPATVLAGANGLPLVQHTLDNGLRVVIREDHTAPAVAVNLWYDVGSRHEQPGRTGLAHLFEHLMFQGSANVASGEHFGLLEPIGAQLNATTSFDRTNYFETVPTGALDLALWLEADRMGGLLAALDQPNLDNQRDVVKNERRQSYDNRPYGTAYERLFALAFPVGHPYHHMPIGSMDDLDAASLADVRAFFSTHYAPGNAVLTLVGDVEPSDALTRVTRFFGPVPGVPLPEAPPEPAATPIDGPVVEQVPADVPAAAAYLVWRLPPDGDPACDAAEVALRVLADGPSSRLEVRLVRREESAEGVGGGVERLVGGAAVGLVTVRAREGHPVTELEAAVVDELVRLGADGPTDRELAQALAGARREHLGQTATFAGLADELSRHATAFGDPSLAWTAVDRLAAVTADGVAAVTRAWLTPQASATVRYLPTAAPRPEEDAR